MLMLVVWVQHLVLWVAQQSSLLEVAQEVVWTVAIGKIVMFNVSLDSYMTATADFKHPMISRCLISLNAVKGLYVSITLHVFYAFDCCNYIMICFDDCIRSSDRRRHNVLVFEKYCICDLF